MTSKKLIFFWVENLPRATKSQQSSTHGNTSTVQNDLGLEQVTVRAATYPPPFHEPWLNYFKISIMRIW